MAIQGYVPCILLLVSLSRAQIFFPPFPPPGQYHSASPGQPGSPQASLAQTQQQIPVNQPNQLLALLQKLLLQSQFPHQQSLQVVQPALDPAAEPPETGEAPVPTSQPAAEAVIEARPVTLAPPMGTAPGTANVGQMTNVLERPVIYNIPNNAPSNPLPIAQIKARFYERLCNQGQSTLPPSIPGFNSFLGLFPVAGDTVDPPACSCIGFIDCESAAHRFINQKTKDECGTILTGYTCCCEEPMGYVGR